MDIDELEASARAEILGDTEADARAKQIIRRLWIVAGVFEAIYVGMLVWEQVPEWRRELIRTRAKERIAKVLAPCHQCRERRRTANRLAYEATEFLASVEGGDA